MNGNVTKWAPLVLSIAVVVVGGAIGYGELKADQNSHSKLDAHTGTRAKLELIGRLDERSKAMGKQIDKIERNVEEQGKEQRQMMRRILEKVSK